MQKVYLVVVKEWNNKKERFNYIDYTVCKNYKTAKKLKEIEEAWWGEGYYVDLKIHTPMLSSKLKELNKKPF